MRVTVFHPVWLWLILAVAGLLAWAWFKNPISPLSARLVRLAREKGGRLTLVETCTALNEDLRRIQDLFQQLADRQLCLQEVAENGVTVYRFPEFEASLPPLLRDQKPLPKGHHPRLLALAAYYQGRLTPCLVAAELAVDVLRAKAQLVSLAETEVCRLTEDGAFLFPELADPGTKDRLL